MSNKKVLTPAEIAEVNGAAGEIGSRYLSLLAENTKTGNTEINAVYLSLLAESTKNAN